MNKSIFVRWFIIGILAGITIYRSFWNLGNSPIERWDEQTNIEVVNGNVTPFFEKPPLWYMVASGIGSIVGITPTSMRSISAVSGVIIILYTAYLAYSWWGMIAGITTWIVLLTTHHLFVTNPAGTFSTHTFRSADVDSLYMLFLLFAFSQCVAFITKKRSLRHAILAGTFSGFAILTKGPFGIVPLIITSIYVFLKQRQKLRHILIMYGMTILITIPWHVFMLFRFGLSFALSYGVYHIALRTITSLEGHREPLWFFLFIIAHPSFFPSFALLPLSLWRIVNDKLLKDVRIQLCFIMAFLCFIVPTIMQTKLAWYILPFYLFSSLIIGAGINSMLKKHASYITIPS